MPPGVSGGILVNWSHLVHIAKIYLELGIGDTLQTEIASSTIGGTEAQFSYLICLTELGWAV